MMQQLSLFDAFTPNEEVIKPAPPPIPRVVRQPKQKQIKETPAQVFTKQYYAIGEVAQLFQVNTSLLRYWEKEFPAYFTHLRKNKKGDRLYGKKEMDAVRMLYHAIKERKMTLEGARSYLKQNKKTLRDEQTLLENLYQVRSFFVDLKNKYYPSNK